MTLSSKPVSIRCHICGMDTTDPEHKPAVCDAVARAVCKEARDD